jgi:hypothetical protein
LALLAALYLAWLVYEQRALLGTAFAQLSLAATGLALLCATLMTTLKGLYHANLLARVSGDRTAQALVFRAYSLSQIVRYLPGKVWGVVYEAAQLAPRFSARAVLVTTAIQMLNTNLLALGVVGAVIASMLLGQAWPLLGVAAAALVVELLHRSPLLEKRLMALMQRWRRTPALDQAVEPGPAPLTATAILLGEWVAYFALWLVLVPDGAVLALQWGTWYASATLLALFALAVPGGIAVREALFVYLGSSADADTTRLVVLGVLLRVILTLGEVAAVAVAELWVRRVAR